MGKKSRRNKAPKEPRERTQRRDEPEEGRINIRWRELSEYGVGGRDVTQLLVNEAHKATGGVMERGDVYKLTEFIYLVVFPVYKKLGREAALRLVRRWPRFLPYWRRVRRRVCEYCGKRNGLSEPRLWVCAGCGVARYCDEECQANDSWHLGDCCLKLACEWDGVGPIPTRLLSEVTNPFNPKVVPSARARKRLEAWVTRPVTPEEVERLRSKKK